MLKLREITDNRSLGRKILDFFKNLIAKTTNWKNFKPSSMAYYQAIRRGKYANKTLRDVTVSRLNREQYTQEMKDILANAPRDSQGRLLAPNGKPSNLTERQYVHVRTKAFKEWFGDWETLAYDNVDLDNIPNLNKINVAEFVNEVNKYLEKDFITREFLNREAVNIINQLFKNIKDVEIFSGDIKEQGLSFYSGKIVISNNIPLSDQAATFVHEIIHNFTTYSYDTNSEFRDEINKYHKRAYIYARKNNLSINSDVYEFMANILSPDTAETLMKIPSDNEKSNLLKDIISSFVKALRIFTNNEIIRGRRTLFHDVVEAIYNNQKDNKAFNNDVSKVVDENGEPLVVYHGSENEFNIFNPNYKKRANLSSVLKDKIYFTSSKYAASRYSSSKQMKDLLKYNELEEGGFSFMEMAEAFGFNPYDEDSLNEAAKYMYDLRNRDIKTNLYEVFLNIREPINLDLKGKLISSLTKEQINNINNSDGAIIKNVDETVARYRGEIVSIRTIVDDYIVSNPNQIKSATDNVGTYSRSNDDIRYRRLGEVRISTLDMVPQEERQILEKKGWTTEHFNRISQRERDKALECLGL